MPMEETGRGVLFRENLNFSSESLVVGIGGIQEEAEGEYTCIATNNITHASISVTIDVKGIYTKCLIVRLTFAFFDSRRWCFTGINLCSIHY